ncbi:hypothetical protein AB0M33_05780 [Micrococcus luteus]|uniref:hypothetical protein n=1 Tax=Micrococcus luteus TaxID=1270 RepID=UPI0029EBE74C|nr:hypothetical protein [Micrococcus luteus]MCV7463423.1 hypothetical protein [Micrococcus luteus]MCV7467694.1 hypothetical protein [Micrococcus luteus]MCV7474711.1 hypothetical protein [Micrococcus luteus]MCV7507687.1 hypothetical protein [Micrococcus luteus]
MAQSRRPDPVAPSESSGADATTVPPRPGRGLPVAVLVVAAALVLEGGALLWFAVDAVVHAADGVLPAGARVMLIVIYALLALWILATAVALLRGRAWSRGAAVAIQLFSVLLSSWLFSVDAAALGGPLLAVSGVAMLTLFTTPVTRHLAPAPEASTDA